MSATVDAKKRRLLAQLELAIGIVRDHPKDEVWRHAGVSLATATIYALVLAFFPTKEAADEFVGEDAAGLTVLGLVVIRGRLEHHALLDNEPKDGPLFPSERLYPSEDLAPGSNFAWRSWEDLTDEDRTWLSSKASAKRHGAYRTHVAGLPVLQTLEQAAQFLAQVVNGD